MRALTQRVEQLEADNTELKAVVAKLANIDTNGGLQSYDGSQARSKHDELSTKFTKVAETCC